MYWVSRTPPGIVTRGDTRDYIKVLLFLIIPLLQGAGSLVSFQDTMLRKIV